MSDQKTTSYPKVGYCNPPEHSRWKRGQSGNPNGRPKSGLTDVAAVLDEPLTVRKAGASERMSAFEVGVRQLVKRALSETI